MADDGKLYASLKMDMVEAYKEQVLPHADYFFPNQTEAELAFLFFSIDIFFWFFRFLVGRTFSSENDALAYESIVSWLSTLLMAVLLTNFIPSTMFEMLSFPVHFFLILPR